MSADRYGYPWHERVQAHVAAQLAEGRMPHALLFRRRPYFYDRHLGYQIAKLLLCNEMTACNRCKHCRLVDSVTHPNLLVFNVFDDKVGIDDIRALEQQMWQTAVFDKPKVAFIHGIDRLSIGAQNALLKTLEEPPENAFFILSVDNISSLPQTIISRVQLIKHQRVVPTVVTEWLKQQLIGTHTMPLDNRIVDNDNDIANMAALAGFAPQRALELLSSGEKVAELKAEKQRVANFIAGKIGVNAVVDKMDNKDWDAQLSRYIGYVDRLIQRLFECLSVVSRDDSESHNGEKDNIPMWQGVSMVSLYRLRDSLLEMRRLTTRNVNMTLQLKSCLGDWQQKRTAQPLRKERMK